MTFGGFSDNKHQTPMSEINVTPMVDVMLVLLVIFIITAPLFTRGLYVELPSTKAGPLPERNATIDLSIDAAGKIYWDGNPMKLEDLGAHFAGEAQKKPQPDLQLRADRGTRYEILARVLSDAQNNGITKIGFVTEPKADTPSPSPAATTPASK
jgi:biopolymer transport protein ExbD